MTRLARSALALALAFVLAAVAPAARADLVVTTETLYLGITHTHASGQFTPTRSLSYDLVDIDLAAPGLHFQVTPGLAGMPGYAQPTTTRAAVDQAGAQIGINANFFVRNADPTAPVQVTGLAASKGDLYAPTPFGSGLNLSASNAATIFEGAPSGIVPYNAISGYGRLVTSGLNTGFDGNDLQPRTAVGLTQSGHLLLLTVDGRNPGHSDGVSFRELADILLQYRAFDAINLDGGGSTSLAFARPTASLINVPSGDSTNPIGTERAVANSLLVFASAVPEPSSIVLFGLGLVSGMAALRGRRLRSALP